MKLNLGCGEKYKKGFLNVDKYSHADLNVDLNVDKWDWWEDNLFDEIHMEHLLEHLDNPYEKIMECYRILKPNGLLIVRLPSDNYGICHKRGRHTRDYMWALTQGNKLQNGECKELFDVKVKGHRKSLRFYLINRLWNFLNLFVTEWEFKMVKK